jgi:hypothetical protein
MSGIYPRLQELKAPSMTLVGKVFRLESTLPRGECRDLLMAVVEIPVFVFGEYSQNKGASALGGSQSLAAQGEGQGTVPRLLPRAT